MKKLLCFALCAGLIYACQPTASAEAEPTKETTEAKAEETGYDAELAESVGADQYGMRQYVMAFLKAGPNRSQDSTEAAALQRAHLDNIGRLAEEGKLSLAGPFLDGGELRGIYIFNVSTIEEAKALTETDPAIQQGRLVMELHPWYGSAALMKVNEIHKRLGKEEI